MGSAVPEYVQLPVQIHEYAARHDDVLSKVRPIQGSDPQCRKHSLFLDTSDLLSLRLSLSYITQMYEHAASGHDILNEVRPSVR